MTIHDYGIRAVVLAANAASLPEVCGDAVLYAQILRTEFRLGSRKHSQRGIEITVAFKLTVDALRLTIFSGKKVANNRKVSLGSS